MRQFMLSAILFIVITSTAAYASPVYIEIRNVASPDVPAITVRCCYFCCTLDDGRLQERLVRRGWLFSQPQGSSDSTPYKLPSDLPNKRDFQVLDRSWPSDLALAQNVTDNSKLKAAYLGEFKVDIAEPKKPNAIMKYIEFSGDRTDTEFKLRWSKIVKELGVLRQLDGTFVWGHSKDLRNVYIAIPMRNKQIAAFDISDPSHDMAMKQFKRSHRGMNL